MIGADEGEVMKHLGARLAAGDQAAFAELYDALVDGLYHYVAVGLRSGQEAEDILQETFLRLVRHRHKLREVANPAAYVFAVARNEALRRTERKHKREIVTENFSAEDPSDNAQVANMAQREAAEQVARAMSDLPPEQREVVELKTRGQFTFREIADITGTPQGTVASRYRAALDFLRRRLTDESP